VPHPYRRYGVHRRVLDLPGRKTDVLDCQWLQYLHSVGLLHASFRPQPGDITGATGLAILDAILGGERSPKALAKLRDRHIKASAETVAKSLVGDYRPEHLFTLRQ